MSFKSEAQAYQAMRKEWKHKRNMAQREASFHQWIVEHQDVHPQIKTIVSAMTGTPVDKVHMAISAHASLDVASACDTVSKYQHMLNKYKVEIEQ